ncbi:Scramblase [Ostertagia ostertagi]
MCCASCYCCRDWITVEVPSGNEIGYVQQRSGCKLNFNVYEQNSKFAYIIGPGCCGCGCCTCCFPEKTFTIYSQSDGSQIGAITKVFGGMLKEYLTDADTFRVTFPTDMAVTAKMILIAAVFLIDFLAFEENAGKKKK